MLPHHSFGNWLKRHRKALDLTQAALADRVGCSAAAIRKFESEERYPSAQIVGRLADVFEIPTPERAAFLKFARGDQRIHLKETVEHTPWHPATPSSRSNIPVAATSIIGREPDIDVLRGYLTNPEIRLITLIGAPGIGKTRLSLELARLAVPNFPDGVFFVPLAPVDDPFLVVPTIVQTLGYVEPKNLSLTAQLMTSIGEKQILLVLDNCEHLIETVALLVPELLSTCPRLKVMVTSREALRVPGEWRYTLTALGIPKEGSSMGMESLEKYPALALFAERARAVRSDFTLNQDNIQTVASICMQLDGLPLAIELIAARIRLMSPQALLERLNDQFVLSADGMRAVSARHKTLNSAIHWSFNLLSQEEQILLACLSVFSGGFTLETATEIFSPTLKDKSVSDLVALLLDKSLLERTLDEHGEIRFDMLATIQQFAGTSLRNMGKESEARDDHLAYFLAIAEKGEREIRGPLQAEWGDRLEYELENFRAGLEWCVSCQKAETGLHLLRALGWPWEVRGHYCEGRGWFEKIRSLPETARYPKLFAQVLNHMGRHSWTQEDFCDAHTFLEHSQEISLTLGVEGEQILADTLNWLGLVTLFYDRDYQSAQSMFEQSLELNQKWGNHRGVALSTFHLGILHSDLRNNELAFSLLQKSLSLFQDHGDLFFIARVSLFLGYEFLKQGQADQARHFFEQHLEIDQKLKFWDGIADAWRDLGYIDYRQGKYEDARGCLDQSVMVCRQHGLKKYDTYFLSGLLALQMCDYSLALQHFSYQLDILRWSDEQRGTAALFLGLAAVAGATNLPQRAAKLVGIAQRIQPDPSQSLHLDTQPILNRPIQTVRQQLGDMIFEKLVAEGTAMTSEQAFAYALK